MMRLVTIPYPIKFRLTQFSAENFSTILKFRLFCAPKFCQSFSWMYFLYFFYICRWEYTFIVNGLAPQPIFSLNPLTLLPLALREPIDHRGPYGPCRIENFLLILWSLFLYFVLLRICPLMPYFGCQSVDRVQISKGCNSVMFTFLSSNLYYIYIT